jgi:FkbM family methyltransferase
MSILTYFKNSFARKKARRVFQDYGTRVDSFVLDNGETVEFANWLNPLIRPKRITRKEIDFFRKYIPDGSFAIDIGANIGDMTVPMSIAAGSQGLVLGFDPNPQVFKVLLANSRLNSGKANIVPLQFAITEKDKEFFFASSEASMSNGGLIEDWNDNRHGKFKLKDPIRGVNLPDYLNAHYAGSMPKLSLIKIDAEGLDYYILKTLVPVLEKHRPTIIMEIYEDLSIQTRDDIFSLLKRFNYSILNIGDFETNIHFEPVAVSTSENMPRPGLTQNILAFA